jgi:HK97 family phage portal protein
MEWIAPCDIRAVLIKRNSGSRFVRYDLNGIGEPLTRADICHVRSPICLDGVYGMSPIRMLRESIGTSLAQTEAAGSLIKNGAKFPGFLESAQVLSPEKIKDAREEFNSKYTGSINAGTIPILNGNFKFQQTHGMTMSDAEFVASRKLEIHEVARHYGIPAFMVDSTATSTWGSGIEQQMLGFMNLSLDSWLVNWEQSLALTLLTTEEIAAGYYFRFDRDQLANVSPATRAQFYTQMRTAGAYSPNDIRRKENEPLISKEDGGDNYGNPNTSAPVAPAASLEPTPAQA